MRVSVCVRRSERACVYACTHVVFFNCLRRPDHFSGWRGEMCAMRAHLGLTAMGREVGEGGWLADCVDGCV